MIILPGKKTAPVSFPWLPNGDYKMVNVVRDRKGLGDFLQILAACERLKEVTGNPVRLYGPKVFVPLGDLSPVEVREHKGEPGRNVCRIKNGEAWVYLDYPCPAIGNEGEDRRMNRLDIFHNALGVEPGNPVFRVSEMEKKKAAKWCKKHTGAEDPFVLVFRSSELWKDYQHSLELFFLMKERGLPVVLLENQMERMPEPNTFGLSIRENCAIISQARMVITPDTGWLHAAAMLKRPVFGLFGAQDPEYRQAIYDTPGSWHCGECPHGRLPCWYQVCEGRKSYQPCMKTDPAIILEKVERTLAKLNRTNGLYFFHIPKTGGTSVTEALKDIPGIVIPEGLRPHDFDPVLCGDSSIFTFIRHPVDRAISAFYWIRQMQGNHAWQIFTRNCKPNDFFENEAALRGLANGATDSMLYSQANRLRDIGRKDITILRYEDGLQEGLKKLGLKATELPRLNFCRELKQTLSGDAVRTIKRAYHDDVLLWHNAENKTEFPDWL